MTTEALTDEQKIAYLAEKVMGWYADEYRGSGSKKGQVLWWDEKHVIHGSVENWNPLTDWNHWRQVEEKLMEDEMLFEAYSNNLPYTGDTLSLSDAKADLPTRCSALIAAHQSLNA